MTKKNIRLSLITGIVLSFLGVVLGLLAWVGTQVDHDPREIFFAWAAIPVFLLATATLLFFWWSNIAKKEYEQECGRELPATSDEFVVVLPCMNQHLKTQAELCDKARGKKQSFMETMENTSLASDADTDANLKKLVELNQGIEDEDVAFARKQARISRVGFSVRRGRVACAAVR